METLYKEIWHNKIPNNHFPQSQWSHLNCQFWIAWQLNHKIPDITNKKFPCSKDLIYYKYCCFFICIILVSLVWFGFWKLKEFNMAAYELRYNLWEGVGSKFMPLIQVLQKIKHYLTVIPEYSEENTIWIGLSLGFCAPVMIMQCLTVSMVTVINRIKEMTSLMQNLVPIGKVCLDR